MDKIDKIFYINLEDRIERKKHFLEQCAIHYIPLDKVERFEAINGSNHIFTKEENDMFKNNIMYKEPTPAIICKKIMGNQLSHYNILKIMKERNYDYIIILQDDVIFKEGFISYIDRIMNCLPDDAEIINFGMHEKADYSHFEPYDLNDNDDNALFLDKQITDFVYSYKQLIQTPTYRQYVNPASLAYIVTKRGCMNILDLFNIYGFYRETDWNYNLYLYSKNIFYGSKYILATGNHHFKSDIFINKESIPLKDLINLDFHYTDKNTTHCYYNIYEQLFTPIRHSVKNVVELGIGNFREKNGGSWLLWNLYFTNATIYGVDFLDESRLYDAIKKSTNIKTYMETNGYDINFVDTVFKEPYIKLDIAIDDGPHTLESNCKFIELYSPLLSDIGILIVEDVQNILWIDKLKEMVPNEFKKYIHIYDLRHVNGRYDDLLFVINKNIENGSQNI